MTTVGDIVRVLEKIFGIHNFSIGRRHHRNYTGQRISPTRGTVRWLAGVTKAQKVMERNFQRREAIFILFPFAEFIRRSELSIL